MVVSLHVASPVSFQFGFMQAVNGHHFGMWYSLQCLEAAFKFNLQIYTVTVICMVFVEEQVLHKQQEISRSQETWFCCFMQKTVVKTTVTKYLDLMKQQLPLPVLWFDLYKTHQCHKNSVCKHLIWKKFEIYLVQQIHWYNWNVCSVTL